MTPTISRFLAALFIGGALLAAPAPSLALRGDCGQPTTNGANPTTTDSLTILRSSVGQVTVCDDKPCICDANGNGTTTTTDSLLVLRKAVGQPVTFNCKCTPDGLPCTSAQFESRTGSDLDSGWTGIAHNSDIILGASINFRTMRRCSDTQAECTKDSDCASNDCVPTCDCNGDTTCEITGPTGDSRCLTTLKQCSTNTDCPSGVACIKTFGPPLPLSSGGTPVCVISVFDGPLTGTANSATGEALTKSNLKSRVFLGITIDKPCPRCGAPSPNLKIGDKATCSGGQFEGAVCTVNGVSVDFGGTSFDCPPPLNANVSGAGLAIRFNEVTTGTTTKTAKLPCSAFGFRNNPLNAPTNPGKCLDNDAACTSNADCRRCTGDATTACTSDANCTGKGTCAESPDQPVTCGYWCQCGFCNNNPSLPCFENSECPDGQVCQQGTGSGTAQNAPQQKPNDCAGDKFICGLQDKELCSNTFQGSCSLQPYRNCQDGSSTCQDNNAGECIVENRPCFESRITRTGDASPLGKYCTDGPATPCTTNTDCTGGATCVDDASRPDTVALFCVPATSSSSINSVGGITGPGAINLKGFLKVCRCGDGSIGCDETCDDSNTNNGDGCSDLCQTE
jgi:cysteine-rich repeat protein